MRRIDGEGEHTPNYPWSLAFLIGEERGDEGKGPLEGEPYQAFISILLRRQMYARERDVGKLEETR